LRRRLTPEGAAIESALWRLRQALIDLERASVEKDLRMARHLLDHEVTEALAEVASTDILETDLLDHLRASVAAVHSELWRPR